MCVDHASGISLVRRVTAGSAIAQAALGCTSRLAVGFLAGTTSDLFSAALEYGSVNQLFE
jgi:hypothetical protein